MTRRFPFGGGQVVLDADAAPVAFEHASDPDRLYLLDEAADTWHGPDHGWGAGFAITSRGSGRWQTPYEIAWRADGTTARHRPVAGLELEVRRQVAGERYTETYTETYTWTNTGDEPLAITGLGFNVPVRDVYDGAATALARSCHAHVFTGGAWSWVLAEPMAGTPPLLGAIVRTGALWAYSVESRNTATSSNIRGHVVVHPTDHARNPEAFGGQPVLRLAPGEEHVLGWELGWYDDREVNYEQSMVAQRRQAEHPYYGRANGPIRCPTGHGSWLRCSGSGFGVRGSGFGVRIANSPCSPCWVPTISPPTRSDATRDVGGTSLEPILDGPGPLRDGD